MALPESVQEIADVIGREAALYLIGQLPKYEVGKPGHRSTRVILYIPKRITPDHRLVAILGMERALKLVDWFGGETLHPPPCNDIPRRFMHAEVRRLANDNHTTAELAEMMGVTERTIRNITRPVAANDNEACDG